MPAPPTGNIDLLRILDAQNCQVEQGASIVFEDENSNGTNNLYTVVDNLTVQITARNDEIKVTDIPDQPDDDNNDDIEFFDEQGNLEPLDIDNVQLSVENSSGIDCDGDGEDGFDDDSFYFSYQNSSKTSKITMEITGMMGTTETTITTTTGYPTTKTTTTGYSTPRRTSTPWTTMTTSSPAA